MLPPPDPSALTPWIRQFSEIGVGLEPPTVKRPGPLAFIGGPANPGPAVEHFLYQSGFRLLERAVLLGTWDFAAINADSHKDRLLAQYVAQSTAPRAIGRARSAVPQQPQHTVRSSSAEGRQPQRGIPRAAASKTSLMQLKE